MWRLCSSHRARKVVSRRHYCHIEPGWTATRVRRSWQHNRGGVSAEPSWSGCPPLTLILPTQTQLFTRMNIEYSWSWTYPFLRLNAHPDATSGKVKYLAALQHALTRPRSPWYPRATSGALLITLVHTAYWKNSGTYVLGKVNILGNNKYVKSKMTCSTQSLDKAQ